jgi:predicted Zn finger-like uncharacterized protein
MGRFKIVSRNIRVKLHPKNIECPHCGQPYNVDEDLGAGDDKVWCIQCEKMFHIGSFIEIHYYSC